jgi:type IX secretion system substrate protein/PKD domain-containing protein
MNIKKLLLIIFCLLSLGAIQAIAQTTPDPGIAGSLPVSKGEYNLGDSIYQLPSPADTIKVEIRGSVHYPSGLAGGPYPVLLFLHGRHSTCYNYSSLSSALTWPCPVGDSPIVSYEGYDYLARNMASHGYIVISISCNKINAVDNGEADLGMQERAELMQHHLDLWNTWNTSAAGPFGGMFMGKLDMQNIGTMGHSRGGEGAIYNALYNRSLGSPYGIKAVLTLAPVDFYRHILNGVPLMNIAPYCDGDVNDLEGVHFYDDSRYSDPTDSSPKHNVLFMGADHNFFNTVWSPAPSYIAGGSDDWFNPLDPYCGHLSLTNKRFDTIKQKAAFLTYAAAFYRLYIGHETRFAPILDTKDIVPPATSMLDSSNVFVSYHPGILDRIDVNRTNNLPTYSINTMGGAVTETGLVASDICGGGLGVPDCGITTHAPQKPHNGSLGAVGGLAQMSMQWDDTTEWYQNDVPAAYQDLTPYEAVQFRSSVNFTTSVFGDSLDFTVQLIDSAGGIGSQVVGNHSHALFFQRGTTTGYLPKVVMNTIQIPLSAFTGVNLTKVRHIRFLYNRSTAGALVVSDIQFSNSACGKLKAAYTYVVGLAAHVTFTNTTTTNQGDSVLWYWNFGDTPSGLSDTSTLKNPSHTFVGPGLHNVCLSVQSFRKNGFVCNDTFCTNIIPATTQVSQQAENQITIVPNPAKDYLQISGAAATDVLTLIDLYGRTVLTTTLAQQTVHLPQTLATGVYYAIVTTASGRVYKKILITR